MLKLITNYNYQVLEPSTIEADRVNNENYLDEIEDEIDYDLEMITKEIVKQKVNQND